MTPESQPISRADLDRAVESIAAAISELRTELRHEFKTPLQTIDRRTERMEVSVNSCLMQLAGMSRSLTVG